MTLATAIGTTIERNNRWFILIAFMMVCLAGSLLSLMVSAAGLMVLFHFFRGNLYYPKNQALLAIAFCFLFYFLANAGLALFHFDGFRNLHYLGELLPFLAFLPIVSALAISSSTNVENNMQRGSALGVLLAIAYQVGNYFLDGGRWAGAMGNPGPYSLAMSVLYAICLISAVNKLGRERTFYTMVSVLAVICILMSGMRGAAPLIVILPLVIAFMSFAAHRWHIVVGTVIFCGLVLISLTSGTGILGAKYSEFLLSLKIIDTGFYDSSIGIRYLIWQYGNEITKIAPLAGLGEYEALSGLNTHLSQVMGRAVGYTHFHNLYLSTMARGGLVELLSTLALITGPVWFIARNKIDSLQAQFGAVLIVCTAYIYVFCGLTNLAFSNDVTDHLFVLVVSICSRITLLR